MKRRTRILYISYCPPEPTWGGAMAFYRHFIERSDFEVAVATTAERMGQVPYTPLRFRGAPWWERLNRTRLRSWSCMAQLLWGDRQFPEALRRMALEFRPDAIFTIAGSWDWTCLLAQKLARELEVPLISSFNDWWDFGWGPFVNVPLPRLVEKRFRRFYRESDLALCTSEGMREALGEHRNSHILYPSGALMPEVVSQRSRDPDEPFTVCFGGTLSEWYGPMIERLVTHCRKVHPEIRFRIFGNGPAWSPGFLAEATRNGTYQGQVPFGRLREEASASDLLLLPMGFGDECAQVERTSFKTKFLDYLSFGRPILVWGPDYCSAVRTAREFDSAECVTDSNASACASSIACLAKKPERLASLVGNAATMYRDRFHPDVIHAGLVRKVDELVGRKVGTIVEPAMGV